jgi:hypothetical protein
VGGLNVGTRCAFLICSPKALLDVIGSLRFVQSENLVDVARLVRACLSKTWQMSLGLSGLLSVAMLREPKGLIAPDASKKPLCLGGFVIHGNSAGTLGRCLDALVAVCDEVVAVDSESRDGSCELCRERGVNSIVQSWQGYGRARAVAAAALAHCDYIFFLDADEWLEPEAFGAFSRWRASAPALPHYTVRRRDWAELANGRRFLYRVETRARLVRRDCAVWQPSWIVHEALPRRASAPLGIFVEHAFADSVAALADKQAIYAFLWALRAHSEKKRSRSAFGRALASTLRDAVL